MDWLVDKSVLLVKAGSHAYGLATPESDLDIRGAVVPPTKLVLGFKEFEQHVGELEVRGLKSDDAVIYSLKKFVQLLLKASPENIEVLFTPRDCVILRDFTGDQLLSNPERFLTNRVAHSFKGSANSHVLNIAKRPNQEKLLKPYFEFGYNTKSAARAIQMLRQGIELLRTGILEYPRKDAEELRNIRAGKYPLDVLKTEIENLFKEIEVAEQETKLPSEPDTGWAEDLVVSAMRSRICLR